MESYTFEYDMDGSHGGSTRGVYKTDGYARAAAMRMFKSRSVNPNDELHIYRSSANPDNLLGKIAYQLDGETVAWFPAERG